MSGNWQLAYLSGVSYTSYWDIESPVNDITFSKTSNTSKLTLIDGSISRRTPTTKFLYEDVELQFNFVSGTSVLLVDASPKKSINTLFEANTKVKFKTHENTTIEGYIQNYADTYKVGQYATASGTFGTFYDLVVTIDITDVN